MVNPTLTYDNEYNRRLKDILTNYDDIEASRNSPTMVTGGMRLKSHVDSGNTPYDGREGTAPFSVSKYGGIRRLPHEMRNPPITDMRYRGRDNLPMPSKEEIMSAYNAVKSGGELIGGNDALHWTKFGIETALKANRIRNQARNIFGGQGKRANRKEDATFWRDFADSTANSMLNLGDTSKKLFGGQGKRANRKEDATFWRDFADGTANSMLKLGDTSKKLFGGKKGGFRLPKRQSPRQQMLSSMNPHERLMFDGLNNAGLGEAMVKTIDNTDYDFYGTGGRGRGKRANRKEDAVFWRDFADNTSKSMLNLGEQGKKLFGGKKGKKGKGGLSLNDFGQIMPKVMAYNAINNATGRKLPPLFGGEKTGCGKKRAVSARGAVVSKVMKEQGLSLPMASKYVKENGLY